MQEFVGVKHLNDIIFAFGLRQETLKREALMFSRIAVPDYEVCASAIREGRKLRSSEMPEYLNELAWLFEKEIAFEPDYVSPYARLTANDEYRNYSEEASRQFDLMDEPIQGLRKNNSNQITIVTHGTIATQCHTRLASLQLRELGNVDAYPIFSTPLLVHPQKNGNKTEIVGILLSTLPIPDGSTSWEQIIEYRSDPDSQAKFLDLRNWMNEVARGALEPIEVEQKLEYLMSQYKRHMALHRMKTNAGTLETVVVSTAEFLEDFVKFKWGKIAKGLFSLKHRRITMMEGELTVPGSEVAYVIKTKEAFSE